ncbi:MAG: TIGR00303 family protein [Nitrosopumilus sp. H8]|nr:MAG: TIGR00303 family protein [Nitrosopumilus sp. H13]RNJ78367.1 MAG: TIGR00303 family protein [Nitrosopumilus sp. H8]
MLADDGRGRDFLDAVRPGRFLFSLVMSYTETCRIPGITIAGASPDTMQFTPPADAEYLHYGHCKVIDQIPMTPDGKPTPGLLTRTALESAGIPHLAINAGGKIVPQLPFVETGLQPGRDITTEDAMTRDQLTRAVDYGMILGRRLASLADCLVIGESIPAGTTTALAVLRALGFEARVSSSIPENPVDLKNKTAGAALERLDSEKPGDVVATVGDPMIPLVAGMLCSASEVSRVVLAGGTQMAAVLAFASSMGFRKENAAVVTTAYVADDPTANFGELVQSVADIPAVAVDPGLEKSRHAGLRAFAEGFAKEGVGAGGSIMSYMLRTGNGPKEFRDAAEKEYLRLTLR